MKRNYYAEFLSSAEQLKNTKENTLLLHACCAPCASSVVPSLKEYFNVTVYFYNPNIDGEEEYYKRANELRRLCQIYDVDCIIEPYTNQEFLEEVKGLEKEIEGGKRCDKCFYLRLKKASIYAIKNGFNAFCTTLTVSPHKNAEKINLIGENLQKEMKVKYLVSDFKKKDGYKNSIELSKKYSLYRQNYCGCTFSKKET